MPLDCGSPSVASSARAQHAGDLVDGSPRCTPKAQPGRFVCLGSAQPSGPDPFPTLGTSDMLGLVSGDLTVINSYQHPGAIAG